MTYASQESLYTKVSELIRQSHSAYAFTGAGISTDSGIPDFRSADSGLWDHVDPLAVASIFGFRHNPQAFYDWVYTLTDVIHDTQPNASHQALADLEKQGLLQGVITQNIDMLHTRAGSHNVFELHGHMREATCINCFTVYEGEPLMRRYLQTRIMPRCPKCGHVIKPNVILFGEQLPYDQLQGAQDAARNADLMLVIGSSLEVAPAGDIPLLAYRRGARLVVINLEPTPVDDLADVVIHERAAQVLPQIMHRLEIVP